MAPPKASSAAGPSAAAAGAGAAFAYSEAHEFALLAWLDHVLRTSSNGVTRLTPLLLRYGQLRERNLVTKALADGLILQTVLKALVPGAEAKKSPEAAMFKRHFGKDVWHKKPKVLDDRRANIRAIFNAASEAFPDLPPFFPASAAISGGGGGVGYATGSFSSSGGGSSSESSATEVDDSPLMVEAGPDGSSSGGCPLGVGLVAGGADRGATLELLWRLFLGATLAAQGRAQRAAGGAAATSSPASSSSSSASSVRYLKEAYEVRDGDTLASVALQRRVKVAELKRLNPAVASDAHLFAGQQLKVSHLGHCMGLPVCVPPNFYISLLHYFS